MIKEREFMLNKVLDKDREFMLKEQEFMLKIGSLCLRSGVSAQKLFIESGSLTKNVGVFCPKMSKLC